MATNSNTHSCNLQKNSDDDPKTYLLYYHESPSNRKQLNK